MRALGLGVIAIAVVAVSALLDHESGVGIWLELQEMAGSAGRVALLVRENEALRREIELLEAEPAALDRAIREELDLALPGEFVVRFVRASGFENHAAEPPSGRLSRRDRARAQSPDQETK